MVEGLAEFGRDRQRRHPAQLDQLLVEHETCLCELLDERGILCIAALVASAGVG
jgi:hypothetical protein